MTITHAGRQAVTIAIGAPAVAESVRAGCEAYAALRRRLATQRLPNGLTLPVAGGT